MFFFMLVVNDDGIQTHKEERAHLGSSVFRCISLRPLVFLYIYYIERQ